MSEMILQFFHTYIYKHFLKWQNGQGQNRGESILDMRRQKARVAARERRAKEMEYYQVGLKFQKNLQGVFFNWSPPESSKCQPVSNFRHLELF